MLIRFIVKNIFSFKDYTELNMLPGRFNRLSDHVYKDHVLKLNTIYGANGAGKSNIIRALALFQQLLLSGNLPIEFITQTFKFDKESSQQDIYLGIEFFKDGTPYYYGITINKGIIIEEELQISGLGKEDDVTLFRRTDNSDRKTLSLAFSEEVNADSDASQFRSFLENEMLERNKPVLHYMKNRKNVVFEPFKKALDWLNTNLVILLPNTWPPAIVLFLGQDKSFNDFITTIIRTLGTGITGIYVDRIPIEKYFGEDDRLEIERITTELRANPEMAKISRNAYEDVVFTLENDRVFAKKLLFSHTEDNGAAKFQFSEESDGTRRLVDLLPILYSLIRSNMTFVIDEIERSIHPLLIKELVRKFSLDKETKGQLIFSTHESNLLDQDIFRPDEVWFAEKNKEGATEMYTLSEFKEHHTIDIRKGYLNGRYGAIPFLGNLKDLNWDKYAEAN